MKRIPLTDAELDAFSRWRKIFCYLSHPGVTKSIKRGYNRRFRRAAKMQVLREGYRD